METLKMADILNPKTETKGYSVSARLNGPFAEYWDLITSHTTAENTTIVKDAIRLMAFLTAQQAVGEKVSTTVAINGKEIKVDDLADFLKLAIAKNPVVEPASQQPESRQTG